MDLAILSRGRPVHFDKIGFRKMRQHVEIFVGGQLSLFDVTREAMACAWFQHTSCNCVSTYKLPFTSMYTRHTSMDIGPILVGSSMHGCRDGCMYCIEISQ